ncbi:hypothetical protein [Streptomyces halstedii]|uniref:hypothetical protein n=1 Tax=Streptomyces halstedii TaxID=1944 RepID=UPI00369C8A78
MTSSTATRSGSKLPTSAVCRSTRTVNNHPADLLRRRLKAIRSRWRMLPPGRIAVIVLAILRHASGWPTWPARAPVSCALCSS